MDAYCMDAYKKYLWTLVCDDFAYQSSSDAHKYARECVNPDYTFNYNDNGQLHSTYDNDKHEYIPAVIRRFINSTYYIYLFDGEIQDHDYPFCIICNHDGSATLVIYYSSERILSAMPIKVFSTADGVSEYYNCYYTRCVKYVIISGYESQINTSRIISMNKDPKHYLVCDELPVTSTKYALRFKFAD